MHRKCRTFVMKTRCKWESDGLEGDQPEAPKHTKMFGSLLVLTEYRLCTHSCYNTCTQVLSSGSLCHYREVDEADHVFTSSLSQNETKVPHIKIYVYEKVKILKGLRRSSPSPSKL